MTDGQSDSCGPRYGHGGTAIWWYPPSSAETISTHPYNIRTLSKNNPLPLNRAPRRQRCRCPRAISTLSLLWQCSVVTEIRCPVAIWTVWLRWHRFCERGSRYGSGIYGKPSAIQILCTVEINPGIHDQPYGVRLFVLNNLHQYKPLLRSTQWWTNTLAGFVWSLICSLLSLTLYLAIRKAHQYHQCGELCLT